MKVVITVEINTCLADRFEIAKKLREVADSGDFEYEVVD